MDSESDSGCVAGTPNSNLSEISDAESDFSDECSDRMSDFNPVCVRPTPSWQLPITRFFSSITSAPIKKSLPTEKAETEKDKERTSEVKQDNSEVLTMECDEPWIGALATLCVAEHTNTLEQKSSRPIKRRHGDEEESSNKKRKT